MTTCMACGQKLKPGFDYPRNPTVIHNVELDGKHPILCWDPVECLKRAGKQDSRAKG